MMAVILFSGIFDCYVLQCMVSPVGNMETSTSILATFHLSLIYHVPRPSPGGDPRDDANLENFDLVRTKCWEA